MFGNAGALPNLISEIARSYAATKATSQSASGNGTASGRQENLEKASANSGGVGGWLSEKLSNAGQMIKNGVLGGTFSTDAEMAEWGNGFKAAQASGDVAQYLRDHPIGNSLKDVALLAATPAARALQGAVIKEAEARAALSATQLSVDSKLSGYLLNAEHPVGGAKAKWFEQALGFNKSNMDGLSKQIVFDPRSAIETGVTQYGTKFNQVIPISGTNGRVIDVTFGWIRNNDGITRLVTAIPTPR
ncbi:MULTISPECIES: DUF6883 domain-containing protein [unclassified Janthinobacterium]|uniref:DUF6883 domain-containing protein n=1 Tax=unclassified Janthinobacterium TaxID=2610881 RepID=UPI00161C6D2D|nr:MULTISPECIES: DUF6883 domain-containing protein [unclassified Janthinobacterium]MBB5371695.1 hypothetical protein [Janthinobacterium sp. K2C7]MBB5384500.1 hypothetical protein [Janthinobacterium sp. K2Li3]MBB5389776.1 hypothetical protein [Janthinobacterium sp. K2E3]